jgi:asparagine synthase (glutamine-hydrolysing)
MCGIVGSFGSNLPQISLGSALRTFNHRGPDQEYFYATEIFSIATNRLAINDVEGGHQPLFGSSNSIIAIYNGEIYNHKELRKNLKQKNIVISSQVDGAVIPFLYEQYGENFIDLLDGMYAIAIFDLNNKKLMLSRDIAGEKPLYYSKNGSGIYFASYLPAFHSLLNSKLSLNYQAIWDLVSFLWIPEPATIYNEVFAIMPGETITFNLDYSSNSRVREFTQNKNFPTDPYEATQYLLEALERNIESCLMSEVPVGTFLSGGLDSSIVTTIAARSKSDLDTFSVSFENSKDPYHGYLDEGPFARVLSKNLGTKHHEIYMSSNLARNLLDDFIKKAGQPFAVSSGLGILAISQSARQNGIKVLLSGDGADELFGGYSWYLQLEKIFKHRSSFKSKVPLTKTMQDTGINLNDRITSIAQYSDEDLLFALHYYGTEEEKKNLFKREFYYDNLFEVSSRILKSQYEFEVTIDSVLESDRNVYLPQEMLRKVDLFTMASSVEGRVPFVRKEIFEISKNLRFSQLVEKGNLKAFLKKSVNSILPIEIVARQKHGFNFPIDKWLVSDWSDLVKETFSRSSRIYSLGIIDANSLIVAEQMLNSKTKLNGHTIFSMIVLERFLQIGESDVCCKA